MGQRFSEVACLAQQNHLQRSAHKLYCTALLVLTRQRRHLFPALNTHATDSNGSCLVNMA